MLLKMAKKSSKKMLVHQPQRRPSLRDLAKKIGVSHTAVAMALRNEPGCSPDLRERIKRIAVDEGYIVSDVTQNLISGGSSTIGIIVPSLYSPFINALVTGISDALWEKQLIPFVLCSELDLVREQQMLKALATKRVGGVIIMPSREDRGENHFVQLLKQHTPIVAVNNLLPNAHIPMVASDDILGGRLATDHLIARGHKHIVHFSPVLDNVNTDCRREEGYVRSMKKAGLKPEIACVSGRRVNLDETLLALETYFATARGRKTTAVFATNDQMAYCVYVYAQRHGLEIGKDLALVGYGNVRAAIVSAADAVDVLHPSLSTIEQHPTQWGKAAVQMLSRISSGQPVAQETMVEPTLIIRGSS